MVSRQFKLFVKVLPDLVESYYVDRNISALSLEERNDLRPRTLFPVFTKLIHAGILRSQAGGNNWGYIFNIDPKVLTLYDALTAVQRLPYPTCSLKHSYADDDCMVCDIITQSLNNLAAKMKKITLYEISELSKSKKQAEKARQKLEYLNIESGINI